MISIDVPIVVTSNSSPMFENRRHSLIVREPKQNLKKVMSCCLGEISKSNIIDDKISLKNLQLTNIIKKLQSPSSLQVTLLPLRKASSCYNLDREPRTDELRNGDLTESRSSSYGSSTPRIYFS